MRPRVLVLLTGLVVLLTFTAGARAAPYFPSGLTQVSGASPFASCTADAGQVGTVFVGSEVEPWIAVNPTNPSNIVGIYQQDRWSNGAARGMRNR